jgi:hypothetical protein
MPTWFTVRLADRPGSLAALASGLASAGVNITGIVGVAEDTGGTLMLTTSDADATRSVLASQAVAFAEHDPEAEPSAGGLRDVRSGLAAHGLDVNR